MFIHLDSEEEETTMNEAQFKLAIQGLNLKESNVAVARDVLVDGSTLTAAGDKVGLTTEAARLIKNKVLENYEKNLKENDCVYIPGLIVKRKYEGLVMQFEDIALEKEPDK